METVDSAREALAGPGLFIAPWQNLVEYNSHFLVEVVLILVILYLLLQKGKPGTSPDQQPLTESEVDQLCAEWQPEPLCPPLSVFEEQKSFPVVESVSGVQVKVDGKVLTSFCSTNFLGIGGRDEILGACKETLNKYGCGSCGPRGFYGTIDVHLKLEDELARFMGTEEAIIYSYDVATLPSIIPAFANRKDLIICDEAVNYTIQNGCKLSRSQVLTFKHNDVADLQRVMEVVAAEDRRLKKKLNRKYVVVEGIYANHGDMAPLDKIFELKERFKYRLIVDESLSLGVLGSTGRGACEHFGIQGRAEIVAASMGNSLASIGGFCCGDREICDHQRLSGSGYCFSASLPPFLATAALGALDYIAGDGKGAISQVQRNATELREMLAASISDLHVVGEQSCALSPIIHLCLSGSRSGGGESAAAELLHGIADFCQKHGVMVPVHSVSRLDANQPPASIRLAVTAQHTEKDLKQLVATLKSACDRVLR
mmetsp:Transcript_38146/g.107806  ORF Transcript_38146/g.107806 Transcript_38146/m.107806 type:complete len:485 (-) Transcript_38146:161-1615(-)